ncbi:MAG TPA: hypothetical protein VF406_03220, partial [Thermodesulfobacteriota bacterium]
EVFRGDPRPMLLAPYVSAAQPVELSVGLAALAVWWRRGRAVRRARAAADTKKASRGRARART